MSRKHSHYYKDHVQHLVTPVLSMHQQVSLEFIVQGDYTYQVVIERKGAVATVMGLDLALPTTLLLLILLLPSSSSRPYIILEP